MALAAAKLPENDEQRETEFRGVLEDAVELIETLAPFCVGGVDELSSMLRHGIDNPAQLRLLMKAATANKKR